MARSIKLGWRMVPLFEQRVALHDRHRETFIEGFRLPTPHPALRATFPASRRRGCAGPAAQGFARVFRLRVVGAIGVLALLIVASAARADAVNDTLAKFLTDKFPQTEAAIGELAAEAPPQAAAILDALGDNRLLIDPADHLVAYKTKAGAILDAKTGQPVAGVDPAAFKKVRVNNALRRAIEGAMGSLTLANPDPEGRIAAAEDVFRTHDAKALPALQAQLAKESDARRWRIEARRGLDHGDERQRFGAGPSLGDRNAQGTRQ
jgi:hypothetical protein